MGERILNDILIGKEDLKGKIKANCGGFNHNFQAIWLVDNLPSYEDEPGLNLTWQVREGIWKHTKIRKKEDRINNGKNDKPLLCNYPEKFRLGGLYPEYDFSVSIEGQIVAQADEIAQRAHDLDDGLKSGNISGDDLKQAKFGFIDFKKIDKLKDYLKNQEIVREIISCFTKRLIESAFININEFWADDSNVKYFNEVHCVNKEIIKFNDPYLEEMKTLERYITSRVINSYDVNVCDGKAIYLIKHVFKAFIANPRQLPVKVLDEITERIEAAGLKCANLRTDGKEDVENCIKIWQGTMPDQYGNITKQHAIFIRAVADHISGMTDNQLNNAYKTLYIPN